MGGFGGHFEGQMKEEHDHTSPRLRRLIICIHLCHCARLCQFKV